MKYWTSHTPLCSKSIQHCLSPRRHGYFPIIPLQSAMRGSWNWIDPLNRFFHPLVILPTLPHLRHCQEDLLALKPKNICPEISARRVWQKSDFLALIFRGKVHRQSQIPPQPHQNIIRQTSLSFGCYMGIKLSASCWWLRLHTRSAQH